MNGLAMLALTGVGIYAIRASFLLAGGRVRLGGHTRRALENARPALLAALVAGAVMPPGAGWSPDLRAVAVVAVAALVARRGGTAAAVPAGLAAIVALGLLA